MRVEMVKRQRLVGVSSIVTVLTDIRNENINLNDHIVGRKYSGYYRVSVIIADERLN